MEMFNWTEIIVLVIGILASICITLVTRQVVPWLKEKKLYEAAMVAVDAAEALYGRYNGESKLKAALTSLKDKGYDIESQTVIEALRAAWKNLDLAMIGSGAKEVPDEALKNVGERFPDELK